MKHRKIISFILALVFSCSLMSFVYAEPQHKDIEGHWAKETMIRAFNDGYIVGMTDGSLAPNGVINRAQVATILNQVFKRSYFKNLINILRQMNYNEFHGERFEQYREELNQILAQNGN